MQVVTFVKLENYFREFSLRGGWVTDEVKVIKPRRRFSQTRIQI